MPASLKQKIRRIDPNKHYSIFELTKLEVFPVELHNTSGYVRFIGSQSTQGNYLTRDMQASSRRGEFPFLGSSVIKFLENIVE